MSKYIVFCYGSVRYNWLHESTKQDGGTSEIEWVAIMWLKPYAYLITDGVVKDWLRSRQRLYIHVVLQFLPKQFVVIDDGSPLNPWGLLTYVVVVCPLATLRKNVRTDLHEIFRKAWQWANEQMITFWWRSGSRIRIRRRYALVCGNMYTRAYHLYSIIYRASSGSLLRLGPPLVECKPWSPKKSFSCKNPCWFYHFEPDTRNLFPT